MKEVILLAKVATHDWRMALLAAAIPFAFAIGFAYHALSDGSLTYWLPQTVWGTAGTILFVIACFFAVGLLVRSYRSVEHTKNKATLHLGLLILAVISLLVAWMVLAFLTGRLLIGFALQQACVSTGFSGPLSSAAAGNILANGGWMGVVYGLCLLAIVVILAYGMVCRLSNWLFGKPHTVRPARPRTPRSPSPRAPRSERVSESQEYGGVDDLFGGDS